MGNNIPYIDKIIPIITSIASPDQIILFGSYARGDNTEKSDLDLLIIKRGLKNSFDIIDSIDRAFYENKIRIPIDLLAIDYNRYNELNSEIGYIYKTIKEEGKVIYGTPLLKDPFDYTEWSRKHYANVDLHEFNMRAVEYDKNNPVVG